MHAYESKLTTVSKHVFFERSARLSILNEISISKKPKVRIIEFGVNLFSLDFHLINSKNYRSIEVFIIVESVEEKEILSFIFSSNNIKPKIILSSDFDDIPINNYDYSFLNQESLGFSNNIDFCIKNSSNMSVIVDKNFLNTVKFKALRDKLSFLQIKTIYDLPTDFSKKNKNKDYIILNVFCNEIPNTTDIISPSHGNLMNIKQEVITQNFPNWVIYCDQSFVDYYTSLVKQNRILKAYHDRDISISSCNSQSGIPVISLKKKEQYILPEILIDKMISTYLNIDCYYCDPQIGSFLIKEKPKGYLVDRSLTIIHGGEIDLEKTKDEGFLEFIKKSQNYDFKNKVLHENLLHYLPVKES